MQYTEVFRTVRLEMAISLIVGVMIGYFFDSIGK